MNKTSLRLLNLLTGRSAPLKPRVSHALEKTARLTLADDEGNVILERLSRDSFTLEVDGSPVFEIAHVRPGQVLTTATARYVLLRPTDFFLHADGGVSNREERHQRLVTNFRAQDLLAGPSDASAARGKPRAPMWLIPAVLSSTIAAVGLATWTPPKAVPLTMSDTAGEMLTVAPKELSEAQPSVVKAQAPVLSPVPATVVVHVPEPKTPPPVATAASASKTTAEASSVAPARERTVRSAMEGLLLEANYDPHKARRELRQLQKTLPPSSALYRELGQAAASIP